MVSNWVQPKAQGSFTSCPPIRTELSLYRSPGHHVDGGSLAEILVGRSATRWLRLYG